MKHVTTGSSSAERPRGAESRRQRDPLTKALQVLDLMVDRHDGVYGVRELAHDLGMAPSSVHRLLGMLEETGMVARDEAGHYGVGFELQRLAWRVTSRFPTPSVAEPVLRDLADRCEETAVLGLFDPGRDQLTIVAIAESRHPLRYIGRLFEGMPVHAGATGMAILAFLDPESQRRIIDEGELEVFTPRTLNRPSELREALDVVRRRGYALTRGHRIPGAVGIAAPVWGPDGKVIGDVIVSMPEQRFREDREPELAHQVMAAAAEITHRIRRRTPFR